MQPAHRARRTGWSSLRRSGSTRAAEAGSPRVLLCRTLSAILDRGGLDLDIALEFLGERLVGEGHLLADALIRPVLPRGLDEDRVLAAGERLAVVVLAVPDDLVLAGRAGRPRRSCRPCRSCRRPADLVAAIPALQVGEPLRTARRRPARPRATGCGPGTRPCPRPRRPRTGGGSAAPSPSGRLISKLTTQLVLVAPGGAGAAVGSAVAPASPAAARPAAAGGAGRGRGRLVAVPAVAPDDPAVGRRRSGTRRPGSDVDQAEALLGREHVEDRRQGVGVGRPLGDDRRAGDPLGGQARPRVEDVRIPPAADPEPALGVAAGGDRPVPDLDRRERLGRLRVRPRGGDPDRPGDRRRRRGGRRRRSAAGRGRRGPVAIAASQARSTMYPLAIALRLSGQSDRRSAVRRRGVEPPGGPAHQGRRLGQLRRRSASGPCRGDR